MSKDFPHIAGRMQPAEIHENNIFLLCATIMQPVRDEFNVWMIITSGFRDDVLNSLVSKWPQSLHKEGKADDFYPSKLILLPKVYEFIRDKLPHAFSQLIYYKKKGVIHVALPHPGVGWQCEVRG